MMRRAAAFLSTFGMLSLGNSRFIVRIDSLVVVNNLVLVDFGVSMMMTMMRSIIFDSLPKRTLQKIPQ